MSDAIVKQLTDFQTTVNTALKAILTAATAENAAAKQAAAKPPVPAAGATPAAPAAGTPPAAPPAIAAPVSAAPHASVDTSGPYGAIRRVRNNIVESEHQTYNSEDFAKRDKDGKIIYVHDPHNDNERGVITDHRKMAEKFPGFGKQARFERKWLRSKFPPKPLPKKKT